MAELHQVAQRQLGGAALVKHHVGHALNFAVPGDGDGGRLEPVFEYGVNDDEALDAAVEQQPRVLLNEVRLAPVADGEVEVALFEQQLLGAGEHLRGVVVVEVGHQHADGEGLPLAQRARVKAGPVIELGRGHGDAVARLLGNGAHARRVVEHQRDGGRRQVEVLTQRAQADRLARGGLGSWF